MSKRRPPNRTLLPRSMTLILFCAGGISIACHQNEYPSPTIFDWDTATESESSDIENDSNTGSEVDSDSNETETIDAIVIHEPLQVTDCIALDDGEGRNPALFGIDGQWFAYFAKNNEYSAPFLVRSKPFALSEFGDAVTVLHGVKKIDVKKEQNQFFALGVRQFYAVLLASTDGINWQEQYNVAPDELTYNCDGFAPAI